MLQTIYCSPLGLRGCLRLQPLCHKSLAIARGSEIAIETVDDRVIGPVGRFPEDEDCGPPGRSCLRLEPRRLTPNRILFSQDPPERCQGRKKATSGSMLLPHVT